MNIKGIYSNRRREHIHIIRQYNFDTGEYTGTRLVIFTKEGIKYIKDYDNFIKHRYKNPKSKTNNNSSWRIKKSSLKDVIIKEMYNTDEDGRLKMHHILYESTTIPLIEYYNVVLKKEKLHLDEDILEFFYKLR